MEEYDEFGNLIIKEDEENDIFNNSLTNPYMAINDPVEGETLDEFGMPVPQQAMRAEEGFWNELWHSVNQYWVAGGNSEETLDIANNVQESILNCKKER